MLKPAFSLCLMLGLIFTGVVFADDWLRVRDAVKPATVAAKNQRSAFDVESGFVYRHLFQFSPDSLDLVQLDPIALEEFIKDRNEIASRKLAEAKVQLAVLINDFPETRAAKEAESILDKAGLRVVDNQVYPKGVFVSAVAFLR